MSLSDFSSVLQLGVGLHAGTALLEPILEFASAPIVSRADRLARIAELRISRLKRMGQPHSSAESILDDLNDIRGLLALDRALFFQEYKIAAAINGVFAIVLYGLLSWAAVHPDRAVDAYLATFLVGMSAGPAVASIAVLWWRWRTNTSAIDKRLIAIHREMTKS